MRPAGYRLASGATIFLSAFLLFWIQPLIAKRILPWFGGATAVWITCLLFFQVVLLAGYCYAHGLARLRRRVQGLAHASVLAASLLLLPVGPSARWKPLGGEDPWTGILVLLAATAGLPYFLLSSTTPLVSSWYARVEGAGPPYRLFALSNLASMLALMAFPALFEPWVGTAAQLEAWSCAYAALAALCGWLALTSGRREAAIGKDEDQVREETQRPRVGERLLWLALPACGSALLLAATNHLTQNVAAIPFLWVLPLGLYLLTFIVAFERERWYRPLFGLVMMAVSLEAMAYGMTGIPSRMAVRVGVPLYALGLFFSCLFCHGELARRRPAKRHLTAYYLAISFGGALGATFVSLIAPHAFVTFTEFPVAMFACAALALVVNWRAGVLRAGVCLAAAGAVAWYGATQWEMLRTESRVMVRNFYGGLRVKEYDDGGDEIRELIHGTINHGMQYVDEARRRRPISYYGPRTGVGWALQKKKLERPKGMRVGVVGLGTGTLAAYGGPGDEFRFYEINPLVEGIARGWFAYLSDSKARISVTLGDGRLSLEREPPRGFDVLAVDAFSSDSIPVHLLTREAMLVYQRQLSPAGILALHISNANLDLRPVASALASGLGRTAWLFSTDADPDEELFSTDWVLIGGEPDLGPRATAAGATPLARRPAFRGWTDDYSNLFQVLK